MFGMDEWIARLSDGASIAIVLLVAVLLGVRHATDPDHLAAVSTLVASGRERATAAAAHLGLWWGIGTRSASRRSASRSSWPSATSPIPSSEDRRPRSRR